MASGDESQLLETGESTSTDKQAPGSEVVSSVADSSSTADFSVPVSSVLEAQAHNEQPQAPAAPPKPR